MLAVSSPFAPAAGDGGGISAHARCGLVRAWTEGYIASSGPDGNETLAVYELGWDEDCMKVFTWFGPDGTPTRAELSLGGEVLCKTEITGFRTEAGYGGSNETAEENLG